MIRCNVVSPLVGIALCLGLLVLGATGCGAGMGSFAANALGQQGVAMQSSDTRDIVRPTANNKVHAWNASKKGEALIYVSQPNGSNGDEIDIFEQSAGHKLVGQIPLNQGGPIAVDSKGNFYVATSGFGGGQLYGYAPGTTAPFLTLQLSGYYPFGLAIDTKGLLAVINRYSDGSSGGPSVQFFKSGSTAPCNTVEASYYSNVSGGAGFDGNGTLYFVGKESGSQWVDDIKGGCHATSIAATGLTGFSGATITDVKVDKSGNIDVLSQGGSVPGALDVFAPGSDTPNKTVSILGEYVSPQTFVFVKSGKKFWMSASGTGSAEYKYPAGGKWRSRIPAGGEYQIGRLAVFPPEKPGP